MVRQAVEVDSGVEGVEEEGVDVVDSNNEISDHQQKFSVRRLFLAHYTTNLSSLSIQCVCLDDMNLRLGGAVC